MRTEILDGAEHTYAEALYDSTTWLLGKVSAAANEGKALYTEAVFFQREGARQEEYCAATPDEIPAMVAEGWDVLESVRWRNYLKPTLYEAAELIGRYAGVVNPYGPANRK